MNIKNVKAYVNTNSEIKVNSDSSDRDVEYFLNRLFGNKSKDAYVNIWTLPNKKSKFFKDLGNAVDYIEKIKFNKIDIYVQCGLLAEDLGPKRRGKKSDIIGLPAFFMDIDIAYDDAHEKKTLPPTFDDALSLIEGYGWDPTLIVNSGHGLHAWWVFAKPWIFENDEDRNKAENMNARLQATIKKRAEEKGWQLDSTFDITRVLRIPGTFNHKIKKKIVDVTLLKKNAFHCSDPMEYEKWLIGEDELQKSSAVHEKLKTSIADKLAPDPNAEFPDERLQELVDIEPKVAVTFEGKRTDFRKNSPSEHAFSLVNCAVKCGWSDQDIYGLIVAFYRRNANNPNFPDIEPLKPVKRPNYVADMIAKVRTTQGSSYGSGPDQKVRINVKNFDLPKATDLAFKAIHKTNEPKILFNMEGNIVRLEISNNRRPTVKPMQVPDIRHELTRRAWYYRSGKDDLESPAYPNNIFMEDVLSTPDPPLPSLTSIKEHAHFSSGATCCMASGYYNFSGCYLHESSALNIPPIAHNPSIAEIDDAKRLLFEELLMDFPFVSYADKINALSIFLLPYVRKMVKGPTPLHCVTAPIAGTGKSLLARILASIVLGYDPEMISPCGSDAEWRKQITAKLINLPEFFIIDNVDGKLDNPALSSALTTSVWEDRYLNKTLMVRCPVECVFIVTGNNIVYSTEISRRVVPIRLDAEVEKPWLRNTDELAHHPIEPWIAENRGNLVWCVLTLINKWLSAGKPKPKKLKHRLGSYESYCSVIGGIFEASGIAGFLDNLMDFYNESDHESDVLTSFVWDWWNEYGNQDVFVSDLLVMVEDNGTPLSLGKGNDHSKKIRLGNYLSHNRNRHIGGFKIIKGKMLKGSRRWRLTHSEIKPVDSHVKDNKNRINST